MPTDLPALPPVGILRCAKCEKLTECSVADLRRYMKTGWPKCCDEVMTYYAPSDKPGASPKA